jgi:hypothetical protein
MVLGALIEEESGKITGQRVVDVEGPKIESSFTMNGKWVGQDVTDIGTYWGVMREVGVVYGEAQGVATTKDGQEMATYTVQGIGRFTSPGKIRFHGSVFYRTTPISGGKLSSVYNMVGVFEYNQDEQGNCFVKVWEWK